jgi:hypothetical protein
MAVLCSVGQVGGVDQSELRRFRGEVYDCFDRRADALFDLVDAVCSAVEVAGVAYLSLAPGARRGHGAGYAALSAGQIDAGMLADVLAGYRPQGWQPDFAVDASVWARCDAECSPERGYYYHPSRHSAGQPILAGWCYSWLVALSTAADSWTAPLDARLGLRIVEGTLIRLHVSRLPGRRHREPKTVWLWWHSPHESDLDLDRVWRPYAVLIHARHEERYEFPQLRATVPAGRLRRLAEVVKVAESAAPTRPHPGAESATANLVAGPALAVADQVRDLIREASGRTDS